MEKNKKAKNYSRFCCVPECKIKNKTELSFHKPPKNENLSKKWLLALKMTHFKSSMRVCSRHFTSQDFFFPTVSCKKCVLKNGVTPSRNLPVTLLTLKNRNPELILKRADRAEKRAGNKSYTAAAILQSTAEVSSAANLQEIESEPTAMEVHLNAVQNTIDAAMDKGASDYAQQTHQYSETKTFVDVGVQVDDYSVPWSSETSDKCIQVSVNTLQRRDESFVRMITTTTKLHAFTGMTSFEQLNNVESCIRELHESRGKNSKCPLTFRELIFLVLIKLKLNIPFICIGALFGIPSSTCQRYFYDTLRDLSAILKGAISWPEKEEMLDDIPECFERHKNTRIVIDCFEISIQKSKCSKYRLLSYPHYKSTHTVKILVGVTPSGLISFVSQPYVGRASDKEVFVKSKLIEKLSPRVDCIMADRGFRIEEVCAKYDVKLIYLPFLSKKKQFTALQSQRTADIAAARVHVERRIQRLRIFSVMKGPLPITLLPYLNMILQVVCGLSNLGPPILPADKFF